MHDRDTACCLVVLNGAKAVSWWFLTDSFCLFSTNLSKTNHHVCPRSTQWIVLAAGSIRPVPRTRSVLAAFKTTSQTIANPVAGRSRRTRQRRAIVLRTSLASGVCGCSTQKLKPILCQRTAIHTRSIVPVDRAVNDFIYLQSVVWNRDEINNDARDSLIWCPIAGNFSVFSLAGLTI